MHFEWGGKPQVSVPATDKPRVLIRTGRLFRHRFYDGNLINIRLPLHISAADGNGHTWGGHLESGCKIYTTAEIVIASFDEIVYKREFAEDSGYEELVVYKL